MSLDDDSADELLQQLGLRRVDPIQEEMKQEEQRPQENISQALESQIERLVRENISQIEEIHRLRSDLEDQKLETKAQIEALKQQSQKSCMGCGGIFEDYVRYFDHLGKVNPCTKVACDGKAKTGELHRDVEVLEDHDNGSTDTRSEVEVITKIKPSENGEMLQPISNLKIGQRQEEESISDQTQPSLDVNDKREKGTRTTGGLFLLGLGALAYIFFSRKPKPKEERPRIPNESADDDDNNEGRTFLNNFLKTYNWNE